MISWWCPSLNSRSLPPAYFLFLPNLNWWHLARRGVTSLLAQSLPPLKHCYQPPSNDTWRDFFNATIIWNLDIRPNSNFVKVWRPDLRHHIRGVPSLRNSNSITFSHYQVPKLKLLSKLSDISMLFLKKGDLLWLLHICCCGEQSLPNPASLLPIKNLSKLHHRINWINQATSLPGLRGKIILENFWDVKVLS